MKKYLYSLIALWLLALPAYALDGDCDYTVGSTTTATGFANCALEIIEAQNRGVIIATTTNSGNDITATSVNSPAISVLRNGTTLVIDSPLTISGAARINLDGTGLKNVLIASGTATGSGDMVSATRYVLTYKLSNTSWYIVGGAGGGGGSGSITASGYTMTTDRLLGRDTASTGAIEELTLGAGLSISGGALNVSAGATNVQTFTSSGTWTKPASGTVALVRLWGAGASAASRTTTGIATGGGGGAHIDKWFQLSSLGATETVTLNAGGAGVSGNTAGNNGGSTTFGSHLTAFGGKGGLTSAASVATEGGAGASPINDLAATNTLGSSGVTTAIAPPLVTIDSGAAGGGCTAGNAAAPGGDSGYGGAGGGAAGTAAGTGGVSTFAGNGGAANVAGNGTAGTAPSGGGGASRTGTSGAGAIGRAEVYVFP